MQALIAATVLCGLTGVASARGLLQADSNTTQPWFCRDGPCPTYQLLESRPNYEIRQYGVNTWIEFSGGGNNYTAAFQNTFLPLYQYLNNFNAANLTISPGGLAVSAVNFSSANTTSMTTAFFISPPLLKNASPPRPLNHNITILNGGVYNGTFAAYSFGGFAQQADIEAAAAALSGNLTADNIAFGQQLYTITYDTPLRVANRHNEIWYPVLDFQASAASPSPITSAG